MNIQSVVTRLQRTFDHIVNVAEDGGSIKEQLRIAQILLHDVLHTPDDLYKLLRALSDSGPIDATTQAASRKAKALSVNAEYEKFQPLFAEAVEQELKKEADLSRAGAKVCGHLRLRAQGASRVLLQVLARVASSVCAWAGESRPQLIGQEASMAEKPPE